MTAQPDASLPRSLAEIPELKPAEWLLGHIPAVDRSQCPWDGFVVWSKGRCCYRVQLQSLGGIQHEMPRCHLVLMEATLHPGCPSVLFLTAGSREASEMSKKFSRLVFPSLV